MPKDLRPILPLRWEFFYLYLNNKNLVILGRKKTYQVTHELLTG